MTNPYLSAAEEVTGRALGQAPTIPVPSRARQSNITQQQAARMPQLKPALKQTNPYMKAIGKDIIHALPQKATFTPLGDLTGFSKIRKMLFLTALGAGFAASLMYAGKLENLILAESPEFLDLKTLLPKLKKAALPVVGLFAFPTALALFTDQEWPMLGWICWLGAVAYLLKETGPGLYRTIKDSNAAAETLKEQKVAVARKRRIRKH